MKFTTINDLLTYTNNIIGKTFADLDKLGLLQKKQDKGALGKVVETGFYGYALNNESKADFEELNVELKVTGFIKNKDKSRSAKERLSLSMIDYFNIVKQPFEFSSLLFKSKLLLIIWYEYKRDTAYHDFVIEDFQLYDMDQDLPIIEMDYKKIQHKVMNGEAHLLSEGDTSYLGAATKSATSKVKRKQPYSSIPAKPRAFSLKQGYLTGILRNPTILSEYPLFTSIEEYIKSKLKPFFRKTQMEIYQTVSQKGMTGSIPKQLSKMISDILIGRDDDLPEKHPLFAKTTHVIKNIPVDHNYYPLERLTFRNIVRSEFNVDWEESSWKSYFEEVTFALICYEGKGKKNGERVLKDVLTISFTDEDLQLLQKSYKMLQNAIGKHDISKLPYPNSFEGQVLEIAPRGKGGDKTYQAFFEKDVTKTCFMISKDFLYKKIAEKLGSKSPT
ncbi:DNA mismatch repair protein MutH [Neobacillus niacini]|uniref:Sau3AI family type II restriction endonuclease n=1 Tax=Neobacillus niacini TaxID=86668 RepID=UPI00285D6596|nr:Sau3AI family type II restriction endonuclease [Neobacillus niacini]MDR7079334.1 DNA mismatch repair protein MutH [Neobacillus niacini]